MSIRFPWYVLVAGLVPVLLACRESPAREDRVATPEPDAFVQVVVRDSMVSDVVEAPARTEPLQATTLSTRLMAHVVAVTVREGDRVSSGMVLVRLDARDLEARREQATATLRSVEAAHHEAELQASRIRALFADSAAPRAQLDAAEAALARASQAVRAARAGISEVETLNEYAALRSPFAGIVTQRFVDEGALASPGSPLLRIEDPSRLRVSAGVPPATAAGLSRNAIVDVLIEGIPVRGRVEGVVPASGMALVLVQVLVDNADGRFSSGSAATIAIRAGTRRAVLVPVSALLTSGDLTGVRIRSAGAVVTRWIRPGRRFGELVEVLSGIAPGDTLVMPVEPAGA